MHIFENTAKTNEFTIQFTHNQMIELRERAECNVMSLTEQLEDILIEELGCE